MNVKFAPISLTVLRLVVGVTFLIHGIPKLQNLSLAANILKAAHFPAPEVLGWIPTIMEPLGGILLILGLATRWVSFYFMFEMFVTGVIIKTIIRGTPYMISGNTPGVGWEIDSLLFAGAFGIAALGAGAWALENMLSRRPSLAEPQPAISTA